MMPEIEEAQKELLGKAELSVWLDSYDDIFSDFDPRPFQERALSDDFLNEARKMVKEKPDGRIELELLMPESLRNKETETVIIKSLHAHFRRFVHAIEHEKKKTNQRGIVLTLCGFILLTVAAYISNLPSRSFIHNTTLVIFEPSGWFLVWTGLDHIFYIARRKKPEAEFNSRMAHAEIVFLSI